MRSLPLVLLMFGVGILSSGCMLTTDTARTMVVEPAEFPPHLDHVALCAHSYRLAEKAWNELRLDGVGHSDDYHKGFINGYADYVQYGGTGEPPPLPPRCYWAKETPEGRQGALDWFAGFRHGASLARQSGVRELIVVPASVPGNQEDNKAAGFPGMATPPIVPSPAFPPAPNVMEPKVPERPQPPK